MKTTAVFIFSALAVLLSCSSNGEGGKIFSFVPKEGKGPITEKEIKADFDEIKVVQSIHAEIVKSDTEKVVISAPSDIIDDVLVDHDGKSVYIHFKPGLNFSANRVKAMIYAKDFSELKVSSSANVNIRDTFTQDKTSVQISSSGSVKGNLEANDLEIDVSSSGEFSGKVWAVNLDVEASSSGDVNISGKAKNAEISVSSSGSVNAQDVNAETVDLKASSSGKVIISVSSVLSASASSAGSIEVIKKGNLNVVSDKESSGGSVNIR